MEYLEASNILGARDSRRIGNNTSLVRLAPDKIGLRLHETFVLTFSPGKTVYNTGGWRTSTTKARFNKFGPSGVRVYSDKKVWNVYREGEYVESYEDGFTWYDDVRDDPDYKSVMANTPMTPYRAVEIAENGSDDEEEFRAAWQYLVNSGLAWTLQGWFGRTAMSMIEDGFITR